VSEYLILPELSKRLHETVETRKDLITSGRCEDFPTYRQTVGEIIGLRIAIDTIQNILEDMKEDGD
jgi:hypothetical protein